jgi:hypothetical protein
MNKELNMKCDNPNCEACVSYRAAKAAFKANKPNVIKVNSISAKALAVLQGAGILVVIV